MSGSVLRLYQRVFEVQDTPNVNIFCETASIDVFHPLQSDELRKDLPAELQLVPEANRLAPVRLCEGHHVALTLSWLPKYPSEAL